VRLPAAAAAATTARRLRWRREHGRMADPRSIVEQLVESMNTRDYDGARQLFASNCRVVTATGRVLDVDGQIDLLAHTVTAFPDVQISVQRWVVDGDTVVTEELFEGTHREPFAGLAPTGRRVRIPVVHVSRVAGGRIIERVAYHDSAAILRQLQADRES
jgi:steroid delta-isomerase-like uncharacterized protein